MRAGGHMFHEPTHGHYRQITRDVLVGLRLEQQKRVVLPAGRTNHDPATILEDLGPAPERLPHGGRGRLTAVHLSEKGAEESFDDVRMARRFTLLDHLNAHHPHPFDGGHLDEWSRLGHDGTRANDWHGLPFQCSLSSLTDVGGADDPLRGRLTVSPAISSLNWISLATS